MCYLLQELHDLLHTVAIAGEERGVHVQTHNPDKLLLSGHNWSYL